MQPSNLSDINNTDDAEDSETSARFGPIGNAIFGFILFVAFAAITYFVPLLSDPEGRGKWGVFYFFIGAFDLLLFFGTIYNIKNIIIARKLESEGMAIPARIIESVFENLGNTESKRSQFKLSCHQNGINYFFYSETYFQDILPFAGVDKIVTIKVNPEDFSSYWIDDSFLPKDTRNAPWPKQQGPLYYRDIGSDAIDKFFGANSKIEKKSQDIETNESVTSPEASSENISQQ